MARNDLFGLLIDAATFGQMQVPCTDTLREEVHQICVNIMADVKTAIENALPGSRSISFDGWTAGCVTTSYACTITISTA
jgi:hypothetical protein